jgi:hypothetical protein
VIGEVERARMLSVPPCGSRVLQHRERIGVRLMREIIRQAARSIWRASLAVRRPQNLVDAPVRWNTSTRAG